MDKQFLDIVKHGLEEEVKKGNLSRRDAMKVLGFASSSAFMGSSLFADDNASNATNGTNGTNATVTAKADPNAKIVIVGGGAAGITVAARLVKADVPAGNITVVEPSDKHIYQPGQTLVAAGVFTAEGIVRDEADFMPDGVKWEKDSVVEFLPETNQVKLASGKTLSYDYLVVGAGLAYHYEKVAGLTKDMVGKDGIHSIYMPQTAPAMWDAMQKINGGNLVFSNPATPIKCGGAPQKIMYLTEDYLRTNNKRANVKINFGTAGGKYFGVPEYHTAVEGFVKEKEINTLFKHNLTEIKAAEKIAIFDKETKIKKFDPDLKEEVEETKIEKVEMKYDLLHVVPAMSPVEAVAKSPLANNKGWMHVDVQTLQSLKYPNVFGIGDNIGTPFGKTGGSVRKQAPVLVQNMLALMNGKQMEGKYNGYTVCPLITRYGRVMMAEFGYDPKQIEAKEPVTKAVAMASFPLDPSVERWIWWLLKVYMLQPMYWHGMLRGRA